MGDNANADWAWKDAANYKHKGVIRQRTAESSQAKVVNMSAAPAATTKAPAASAPSVATAVSASAPPHVREDRKKRDRHGSDDESVHRRDKKRKKDGKDSSKHKKSKKDHKDSTNDQSRGVIERDSFNPILQCLASRLSNKTRIFTLDNE